MSPSSRPPLSTVESAPASRTRIEEPDQILRALSQDGRAAVLMYARRILAEERRRTPSLKDVTLRVFVGRVDLAASDATEGVSGDYILIASLYRLLADRGETAELTLSAFKARLVLAHRQNWVGLSACNSTKNLNPMMVSASALRVGGSVCHCVSRMRQLSLAEALEDVRAALSAAGDEDVLAFARKAKSDEIRRNGRPRLFTLSAKEFGKRVQEVANEAPEDMLVDELYWYFEDHGEAIGLDIAAFKGRVAQACREGAIRVTDCEGRVRRSRTPQPVPWGPPARLVPPPPKSPWAGV